MIEAVRPDARYRDSFLAALAEFQAEGRHAEVDPAHIAEHFDDYVRDWLQKTDPRHVEPGKVPETVLWLVDGDTYLGRASVRHALTPLLLEWGGHIGYEIRPTARRKGYGTEILRLALIEARALGLERVLVTCDETNIGSRKIIEANGGVFENAVLVAGHTVKTRRYWINVPA